jgi:hypothetical protein
MNYEVLWLPAAEQELAALWLSAQDRDAVTRAAHTIDQRLQANAPDEGESRDEDDRIVIEAPLAVLVEVRIQERLARVLHVWRFGQGPKPE